MKKLIALLTVSVLLFSALAETVSRVDPSLNVELLSRSLSWSEDENGDFTVRSDRADMVKEAFEERIATYGSGGLLCFFAELRGNTRTLVSYPVLNILFVNATPVNARAVSFALDGVRYDFAVSAATVNHGRTRVESLSVYLDADGAAFLKKLSGCDKVEIGLWGDGQYTLSIDRNVNSANARLELAAKSLSAAELPEGSPDFESYPFAAQTELAWEKNTGLKALTEIHRIPSDAVIPGDAAFGLIGATSPSNSVRELQNLLYTQGLMMGTVQMTVTDAMRNAVMREQARLSRIPTGYADDALVRAIQSRMSVPFGEETEEPIYACESEMARFSLGRWWTAGAVQTSAAAQKREAGDGDNVLLIADGQIQSLYSGEISLSWEATAEMVYGGKWAFPAVMYCETDEGNAFSSTLGILARSRLVIASEIPGYLINGGEDWTLKIRFGKEEFEFDLR